MLQNSSEPTATLTLIRNITLDLNGKTLEAMFVMSAFDNSAIIDSTNGAGLLKVARENFAIKDNTYITLWIAEDAGFRFQTISVTADVEARDNGATAFAYFWFDESQLNSVLANELKDGGLDNGFYMGFIVRYKTAEGINAAVPYYYSDKLVKSYASDWVNSWAHMTLRGVDAVSDLTITVFVSYDNPETGVVVELTDPMPFGN